MTKNCVVLVAGTLAGSVNSSPWSEALCRPSLRPATCPVSRSFAQTPLAVHVPLFLLHVQPVLQTLMVRLKFKKKKGKSFPLQTRVALMVPGR